MGILSTKPSNLKATVESSLKQLAAAIDDQAASAELKRYLDLQARFHRYSWSNCWLIAMVRPDATMVAGFTQWKRMDRTIKPGEKAIRILAPCPVRRENPATGDAEDRLFFKSACVWDISQTRGKPVADFALPEVHADAFDLLSRLKQVASRRGVIVQYQQLEAGHYGVSKGGTVVIGTGFSTGQQAKTLAHELTHETMHRHATGDPDQSLRRDARELEAEAVAYVVCKHFDLDVTLRASRYIALWGGDAKQLAASLSRISRTARELIEEVESVQEPPVLSDRELNDTTSPSSTGSMLLH